MQFDENKLFKPKKVLLDMNCEGIKKFRIKIIKQTVIKYSLIATIIFDEHKVHGYTNLTKRDPDKNIVRHLMKQNRPTSMAQNMQT